MINGKISEKYLNDSVTNFSIAGTVAYKYSTYRDSVPKIYLFDDYSFDYIYSSFLKLNPIKSLLGSNKDIIISLCFNPYFTQFYDRVTNDYSVLTTSQKKMLYNGFLKHYSLESTKLLFETEDSLVEKDIQKIYIETSAYNKCKKLIKLFNI